MAIFNESFLDAFKKKKPEPNQNKTNSVDIESAKKARAAEFNKVVEIAKEAIKEAKVKYKSKYSGLSISGCTTVYYNKLSEEDGDSQYDDYLEGNKYGQTITVVKCELQKEDQSDHEAFEFVFDTMKQKIKQDSAITGSIETDGYKNQYTIDYRSGIKTK